MEWIKISDRMPRKGLMVLWGHEDIFKNEVACWPQGMSENYFRDCYTHWLEIPPIENGIEGLPFEGFWAQYPIKVAKVKCEKKWYSLAVKHQKAIMDILPRYLAHKPFAEYTHPNPMTFLNQRRWEDPIPESNSNNGMVY